MAEVKIYRFNVAGKWSTSTGILKDKYVVDHRSKQAHAVRRSDFFVPNKPAVDVDTPTYLSTLEPPEPPYDQHQRAIVVEDHSILPLTPSKESPPLELVERIADLAIATTEQKAPLEAEAKDGKNSGAMLWYRILAGSFMLLTFGGLGIAAAVWFFNSGPGATIAS